LAIINYPLSILVVILASFIHYENAITKEIISNKLQIIENDLGATKSLATNTDEARAKLYTKFQTNIAAALAMLETEFEANITKAQSELEVKFQANINRVQSELEAKFQANITKAQSVLETKFQKRITELETKLELQETKVLWNMIINHNTLSSNDQVVPVIVKMSEYAMKKRDETFWYSYLFYTHHKGYNMHLKVRAAGVNHLSVFLHHVKGRYDDQLEWGQLLYCEVKLLNQISKYEHIVKHRKKIVIRKRSALLWSIDLFISYEYLHKINKTCQYIKNDSIFFEINVTM